MSLRFFFWTALVLLLISGSAGWFFYGDHEMAREAERLEARQELLLAARGRAEAGGPEAWTGYARTLLDSPGELRDPKEAVRWLTRAAEKGYAPAQLMLGDRYAAGDGVRQSHHRAVDWYTLAARLGDLAEAHFRLGEAYFRGLGVPQDYAAAVPHYEKAAKRGHPVASYILGSMHEAGWGVDRDPIRAWVLYTHALPEKARVARHAEDYDVEAALRRLEGAMNASQLDLARRRLAAGG